MKHEFQAIYRETIAPNHVTPVGPVQTVNVVAEADDQVRAMFREAGLIVIGVTAVRALVDWELPNFERDEAAEFLRIKGGTLSTNKGNGEIPFAAIGKGVYPRHLLERYIENNLNKAGEKLLEEIKAAA